MEVVVEMEEMETVAHDITRLVVEGRPGTQARLRAGLDAFFASSALHRGLGERQRFWFWAETRCTFLKRHFIPQEIDPLHQTVSPRATFISFRNVVAAPRYPLDASLLGIGGLKALPGLNPKAVLTVVQL